MSGDVAVTRFKNQVLQMVDLQQLSWPSPELLRREDLQQVLWATIFSPDALRYAPPDRYQSRVLKELVQRIEAAIVDPDDDTIHDGLASQSALLTSTAVSELAAAQQKSYVTYTFSEDGVGVDSLFPVTLLENPALIMIAGTTGVRSWEAARHLGAFLCTPGGKSFVAEHNVLELGAGTGLVSIICARHLGAQHVLATDGDPGIVENIRTNYFLNSLDGTPGAECQVLRWGTALLGLDREDLMKGMYDVILGADITYDAKLFPSLLATIAELLKVQPRATVILSATVRNQDTLTEFADRCRSRGLSIQDIQYSQAAPANTTGPFYSDTVPIRLMRIASSTGVSPHRGPV